MYFKTIFTKVFDEFTKEIVSLALKAGEAVQVKCITDDSVEAEFISWTVRNYNVVPVYNSEGEQHLYLRGYNELFKSQLAKVRYPDVF